MNDKPRASYDRYSWKSLTDMKQPASSEKSWMEMTDEEKDALVVLGYSEYTWDSRELVSSYK